MDDDPIRVVVADDHPIFREGVASLLTSASDIVVVATAANGESALRAIMDLCPHVAILDISMPGLDGITVVQRARAMQSQTRFGMMSLYEERAFVERALDAGATGYIVKRSTSDSLLHAVRALKNGGLYLDPSVARRNAVPGAQNGRLHNPVAGFTAQITEREREVLRLVAFGFTAKEIGGRLGIAAKSVETHKARASEKLGLTSRAKLVQYALMKGWLSCDPSER